MTNIDIRDFDAVGNAWEAAQNISTAEKKGFPLGHIFDEEKSVKWNREEVTRRNEEIRQYNIEQRKQKIAERNKADGMIIEYLYYSCDEKFNREILKKLFNYVLSGNEDEHIRVTIQECEDILDIFLERYNY